MAMDMGAMMKMMAAKNQFEKNQSASGKDYRPFSKIREYDGRMS